MRWIMSALALVGLAVGVSWWALRGGDASRLSCTGTACEEWRNAEGLPDWNRRAHLLEELKRHVLVRGMSERAVVGCLGPPEDTTDGDLGYIIGNQSGLGIDLVWLWISFDSHRKVIYWVTLQG